MKKTRIFALQRLLNVFLKKESRSSHYRLVGFLNFKYVVVNARNISSKVQSSSISIIIPALSGENPEQLWELLVKWVERNGVDLLRLNIDFFAILTISILAGKKVRILTIHLLGTGLYLVFFLYEIYEAIIFVIFGKKTVIYNDVSLIKNVWYLISDIQTVQGAFLWGVFILLAIWATWFVYGFFRLFFNWADHFNPHYLMGFGSLLWLIILFFGFQSAPAAKRYISHSITPGIISNIRRSVNIHKKKYAHDLNSDQFDYGTYENISMIEKPNIYLFIVESYGKVLIQRSELKKPYVRLMKDMEESLKINKWYMSTNYSIAPIRGGRSWLSIATILSGRRLDNQTYFLRFINHTQKKYHLTQFLNHLGYSTVTLQPPNRQRIGLPLLNPYEYKTTLFFKDLHYKGEAYGWGIVPDQYSLYFAHETFLKTIQQPFFLFFLTATPHAPWDMLPPFVSDWRLLNQKKETLENRLTNAQFPVKPSNFIKGFSLKNYFNHIVYDIRLLQRYILKKIPENSIIIIIGDHQPALLSYVDTHGFETPIHILAKKKAFIKFFESYGFVPGLIKSSEETDQIRHEALFSLFVRAMARQYSAVDTTLLPPYFPDGIDL